MKTKSRNLIISFLLMIAMLFSVFAISPMTASALSITPTPEETPAETIYVGGVTLNAGQYVKNGETTATTGQPAEDESGFAYYTSDGLLFLVDYEYEGTGYTHDISEKSVIYSEGKLEIILFGKNSIKNNTADTDIWAANGIRAKGNLIIDGPGALTIDAPYAIYGNNLVKFEYGRTVIPSATVAIEAGGNFIVNGGVLELHSTKPIEAAASFISGGSFFATAEQGVFQAAPTISVDTEDEYSLYICTDVEGTNQVAYLPENIAQYKYFAVLPPTPTEIDSISVSDIEVPEVGDSFIELDLYEATYGDNYYLDSWNLEVYVGGRWIEAEGLRVTEGLKYRFILWICPEEGYDISADISGDDISFNGGQVTEFKLNEYPDYNELEIYYEFHYGELIDPLIGGIEISGLTLPVAGQTADSWPFNPDMLTFGGNYDFNSCGMQEYNGTEWVLMEGDRILTGVRYRFVIMLRADEGYFFSPELTSDDVTIGDDDAVLLEIDPTGEYAVVAAEFYYEAPATDYDITIADKDDSGATVGVLITEENCADVLGDGTVSYDPTTNTLTLNNYVYNGEGALVDDGGYMAIMADIPAEGLTIVLVGTNSITVSGSESAGMVFFGEGDLAVKGNGSLSINSIMYGITLQSDSGKLTTENAKLNITTTGAMAIGIQATDFVMSSGDLKITASMIGIGTSKETGICINGGSVEIGTATGGYAFIYLDFEHLSFNPIKPDLSGYVGAYKMTAGVNADGSDATDFNEGYLNSYKYVKVEPNHVHDHGTTWKTDANNHWNECSCGDKANKAAHTDGDNNGKCDTCEYQMSTGLGAGAIVGIVIGSVLVVGIGGFALVWFVIKKKTWAEFLAIFKKK